MTTGDRQGAWRLAARVARRCCSFPILFAAASAGTLVLAPLTSMAPEIRSIEMRPYVPQYPHQAYGYELALAGFARNREATEWLAGAERALLEPERVALPFRKQEALASSAAAAGFAFTVPVGRRVAVRLDGARDAGHELFVDLFRVESGRYERVAGALPGSGPEPFAIDVIEGGDYVLRMQPPIGAAAQFALEVTASAMLAFPVQGATRSAIWSGFGAERDGGRRSHRGVDIFAARGTPVLAATDGWVTRVETTRVGGNVIWMQPLFGNMRVYYAHLHEQWVKPGDFVLAGEPLGSVGNTGNAITTPPHLHFGVYVRQPGLRGGARDPAEFLR
jgi:murein DD-endopeptidase MepM/ murein hydrolase activator NlpD